ncbi:MAG: UDP-N-acetylglucosamine 2-epimerase [Bacteriovoracaceae bacterium]
MIKKKIALFTTTRAEFGAFVPLIRAIEKSDNLEYVLFVGGSHIGKEFGQTIEEIRKENIKIARVFDFLLNENTPASLLKSCGICSMELSHLFQHHEFDIVCLAGDRYELIPIALASILFRKPIAHLYGGEITEGIIDEQIRHMLTKSAHLHFASCHLYAENVIKMGEESWRVHNVGELVIDNIKRVPVVSKDEVLQQVGIDPSQNLALLTYHPDTVQNAFESVNNFKKVIESLKFYQGQILITAPGAEVGSTEILKYIEGLVRTDSQFKFIHSLGIVRYYSLLPFCDFMIGNSSSGMLEAPFFKVPTINVGNRQKGRLLHKSVVNVSCEIDEIKSAINKVTSPEFKNEIKAMEFMLGDGHAADKIVKVLSTVDFDLKLLTKSLKFER